MTAVAKIGGAVPDDAWRRWFVLLISSVGVFLAAVSTSALIIAFPTVLRELRAPIATMMWILLVVLLAICAMVPIAGRLGDIVGPAPLYKLGLWIFVLGSLGGGFARTEYHGDDLLAARVFIGIGAAFLFVNSSAILTDAFAPHGQVGLAQGVFQLAASLGSVLGPLVGGGLSEESEESWRWIFWFNVPTGGVMAILAMFVVKDHRKPVKKSAKEHFRSFDWVGAVCCTLGLILLLLAGIQAVAPDPVLSQKGPLAGLIVAGCISGVIFIADQFWQDRNGGIPLIPPSVFKNRVFTATTIAGTLMSFARNSITCEC